MDPLYEPIDLSTFAATDAISTPLAGIATGDRTYHGLPFRVGGDGRLIALGRGCRTDAIAIPVGKTARRLIVAHRAFPGPDDDAGDLVAEWTIRAGGESITVPVRMRLEVDGPMGAPFHARPDQKDFMQPQYAGPWDLAGWRLTEVDQGFPESFWLWTWTNPRPEVIIDRIDVVPRGALYVVGGITLSRADEEPFPSEPARPVVITLLREEDARRNNPGADVRLTTDHDGFLTVEVDRGTAGYVRPLPRESVEDFLRDPFAGWGAPQNRTNSPSYAEIAAIPSATVTVKQNGETIGSAKWGDVAEKGSVDASDRVRIEIVNRGRNWVHTRVVDEATGKPVPCRIAFRSPEGIPYPPHGHPIQPGTHLESWHYDIGGDVRLGQITYAYIDGKCQGWLPRGDVFVDVARGFEYEPLRTRVAVDPGQRELVVTLRRAHDLNAEGWYSGDTHVHFLSTVGGHLEAAGEGLNVVNLLASQWGHLFTNTEEFVGRASISPDGNTIVWASQENRQHLLGHLSLLGLKEPVMPWCSDGPNEAEIGGALESTMAAWADRCRAQGGTVIVPHFPSPNGEPASLIATGRADAVEMTIQYMPSHAEYYRYLNCGYRLPVVGGTDKMAAEVPVGLYRTYARIRDGEPFTFENWCAALRAGRTFLTSGPLLRFSVEGHEIGDTVRLPGNGGEVDVVAEAESVLPLHRLEIVVAGRVVAAVEEPAGARRLVLRERVKVAGNTWIAARAGGPGYDRPVFHYDTVKWGGRAIMAHTSPIYVACGGEWSMFDPATAAYMLTLIHGSLEYIRDIARLDPPGTATHHHGEPDHRAWLARPLIEARDAVERRVREGR